MPVLRGQELILLIVNYRKGTIFSIYLLFTSAGHLQKIVGNCSETKAGKLITVTFCGHHAQGWKTYHCKFLWPFYQRVDNLSL